MSAKYALARASVWGVATLWAAVVLALGTAASACELAVDAPEAARVEYNPFALGSSSGPLDIVFGNKGERVCELRLVLVNDVGDPLPLLDLGGVVIEFKPRETSGLFRRDTEPGAFVLSIPGTSVARAELDVTVVRNAVVEAGIHQADLRLSVEAVDGEALLPPIPLHVILQSAPRAQVNIAGAAGSFASESSVEVVDFGTAATGITRQVFVQVRANTQSTLTVKSQHRGLLHHVEMGDRGTVIAYTVVLDGRPVDLAEAWSYRVDPPRTLAGVSLPMDLTLGAVTGQMSGRYEDLITIDIAPD